MAPSRPLLPMMAVQCRNSRGPQLLTSQFRASTVNLRLQNTMQDQGFMFGSAGFFSCSCASSCARLNFVKDQTLLEWEASSDVPTTEQVLMMLNHEIHHPARPGSRLFGVLNTLKGDIASGIQDMRHYTLLNTTKEDS